LHVFFIQYTAAFFLVGLAEFLRFLSPLSRSRPASKWVVLIDFPGSTTVQASYPYFPACFEERPSWEAKAQCLFVLHIFPAIVGAILWDQVLVSPCT